MTVRFLKAWNGYNDQSIAALSTGEEARLIGLGIAENYAGESKLTILTRGTDGPLTWTENGQLYTATYSAGNLDTVTSGSVVKRFSYSGGQLSGVTVGVA